MALFHKLTAPSFDLCWLTFPDDESFLLMPGGGGSAKSGIINQIQIARLGKSCILETLPPFKTDGSDGKSNLCNCIGSGTLQVP